MSNRAEQYEVKASEYREARLAIAEHTKVDEERNSYLEVVRVASIAEGQDYIRELLLAIFRYKPRKYLLQLHREIKESYQAVAIGKVSQVIVDENLRLYDLVVERAESACYFAVNKEVLEDEK